MSRLLFITRRVFSVDYSKNRRCQKTLFGLGGETNLNHLGKLWPGPERHACREFTDEANNKTKTIHLHTKSGHF